MWGDFIKVVVKRKVLKGYECFEMNFSLRLILNIFLILCILFDGVVWYGGVELYI